MSEDSRFSFHSLGPEQTHQAARALAGVLPPAEGIVLSLCGGLGVGKTQFVKGLAAGLGLDPARVTSPTFAIVNEYGVASGTRLVHMDFYRLESEMALEEVGFLDLLAMDAVLAIEWGDRFVRSLPADRMEIQIARPALHYDPGQVIGVTPAQTAGREVADEESPREFCANATGPASSRVLQAWSDALLPGNEE